MRKTLSVTRNSLFKRLYSKGKSAASYDIVIYTLVNKSGGNRLGITVSTKIGSAVVRNRIRRRLKEAYRTIENNIPDGINLVIVARSAAKDKKMPELRDSLEKLLRKNNLWVSL